MISEVIARFPRLQPGDAIIANDPDSGGGTHLSDVALVRPVFVDDELTAFAAAKGHWTDVGGKDPGSGTPIRPRSMPRDCSSRLYTHTGTVLSFLT